MNVERELHRLVADSLSDDPRTALSSCRQLARDQLPWLTERAVTAARRAGWSWASVGTLCGVSPQAARQRFGRLDALAAPSLSPKQPQWGGTQSIDTVRHRRDQRIAHDLRDWEASGFDIVPW